MTSFSKMQLMREETTENQASTAAVKMLISFSIPRKVTLLETTHLIKGQRISSEMEVSARP